ncbi:sulfate reduction electron transfer complex DsrMKJOP subunit DsrJ [Thermodesulfovibrionales bacterium]|nr:sulfate reduction electron transfer complex DsrMKJOP subunit DsrJ [Thermodesulfovibrionales bacterium]
MYDSGKVIIGIAIFLAFVMFPFYINIGVVVEKPEPCLDTPVIQALEIKECVKPAHIMRATHIALLDNWKDLASRYGERLFVTEDKREFDISLQMTCMHCHSNYERFCMECHAFVAIDVGCWECHVVPEKETMR